MAERLMGVYTVIYVLSQVDESLVDVAQLQVKRAHVLVDALAHMHHQSHVREEPPQIRVPELRPVQTSH